MRNTKEMREEARERMLLYWSKEGNIEAARQKCIARNKSEDGRAVSRKTKHPHLQTKEAIEMARKNGQNQIGRLVVWNKSKEGREAARANAKRCLHRLEDKEKWAKAVIEGKRKSEKFKESCKQNIQKLITWNRTEEGRRIKSRIGKMCGAQNLAKTMAVNPTKSQKLLSESLKAVGIKHILEYWVPKVKRIIDIAVPELNLAIEVDGATHSDKSFIRLFGKSLKEKMRDDELKNQQLKSLGWNLIRITDQEVNNKLSNSIDEIKSQFMTQFLLKLHKIPDMKGKIKFTINMATLV